MEEMERIKQIIPVPDNITVMLPADEDGKPFLFDTAREGWPAFFALVEVDGEDEVAAYTLDSYGSPSISRDAKFLPAVRCRCCGAKMFVRDQDELNFRTAQYECPCGAAFSRETGWTDEGET